MKFRGKANECSLLSIYLWFHLLLSHKEPIIWHWSRIYCILLEALKPKFPFPQWLQVARQEDNGKLGSLNVIGCNFPEPLFKNKEVFLWKELKVRHWLSIKISSCSQRTVKQVLKIWISPPNAFRTFKPINHLDYVIKYLYHSFTQNLQFLLQCFHEY